jgi:hypothetical protein
MSQPLPSVPQSPPELPVPRRRRRWVSLLLAGVIFASGFVAGTATAVVVIHKRLVNAIHFPERAPEVLTSRLRRSLGLSDAQAAEVKKILQARQAALQEIRRRVQPEVEGQIDRVEVEIAAVLEPAQQVKWHALLKQLRATWLPPAPRPSGSERPPSAKPE